MAKKQAVRNCRDSSLHSSRHSLQSDNMRERKRQRLENFDYSSDNMYFVTLITKNRINYFGKIRENKIILNTYGEIVNKQWLWLAEQYSYIILKEYIIMPNHLHGIIQIDREEVINKDSNIKIKSLSEIIGAFKTTSSKLIRLSNDENFQWHKSFYDHIIRNYEDLIRIQEYIVNNPLKWNDDDYFIL